MQGRVAVAVSCILRVHQRLLACRRVTKNAKPTKNPKRGVMEMRGDHYFTDLSVEYGIAGQGI